MYTCVYLCSPHPCRSPRQSEEHVGAVDLELQVAMSRHEEPHLGSLQERYVLLITEPSSSSIFCIKKPFFSILRMTIFK